MPLARSTFVLLALLATAGLAHAANEPSKPLTVFAAASLTDALNEINAIYTKTSGVAVRASYASSSALARQIEAGAKADVFFSADLEWVDYLQARALIDASTRRNVLGNKLVLIAPADSQTALRIAPNFALAAAVGKSRLATGDPDSVPVGRYARRSPRLACGMTWRIDLFARITYVLRSPTWRAAKRRSASCTKPTRVWKGKCASSIRFRPTRTCPSCTRSR
jgi:ABC-type molybdate transport system substrate-binding protein